MILSIGMLGPLVIESVDCPLGKLPKKARGLIAYLAAEGGQAVSRERLADLLWPYQGSEQSRHSLRNCILELRKALGRAAVHLVADFSHCRLEGIADDLGQFENLSRSSQPAQLQAAADLYRGEFLADFHIASEPFQEWLASERDRTLGLACDVLQRLTAAYDAAGNPEAAIRCGRRLVALEPLSEIGQRALMRSYALAGRRAEALRQYRSCSEILKRELGVTPDAETQALSEEIASRNEVSIPSRAEAFSFRTIPDCAPQRCDPQRAAPPSSGSVTVQWPCLLPSIAVAVAPVRNLTGEPERHYLAEAFTDDLVTDLLRHGRGLSLKPLQDEGVAPGRPLPHFDGGWNYVVTGSIQRGNTGTMRVNMRITNASRSEYLWSGRHEFRPEDFAALQPRITRRISRELHLLLLQVASRRAAAALGIELGVGECLSRAAEALAKGMRAELAAEAQGWYLAALAEDPRNVAALTGLAQTCQHLVSNPWWGGPRAAAAAADLGREAAALALSIAPGHADAHCVQGMLYSAAGQLEEAARAFQQTLAMDHGLGVAHGFEGYNTAFLGRAEETLPAVNRAMRLDRTDRRHSIWLFFGGFSELLLGRTEDAITLLNKSLERNPTYGTAQLFLTAALSSIGRRGDAAERAAAFRSRYPDYRASAFEQLWLSRSSTATYRAQIHPLYENICALGMAN